ncbi:hypothetical protein BBJ28_00012646, partial [Nothophytophthora sp. Chile5]
TSNMTSNAIADVGGGSTDRMGKKMQQGPDTPHPLPATHVADIDGRNSGASPFFGCFSSLMPNCCMSTICSCVSIAQIQALMEKCYQTMLSRHDVVKFGLGISAFMAIADIFMTDTTPSSRVHGGVEGDDHMFHRSMGSRLEIFVRCSFFFFLGYSVLGCVLRALLRLCRHALHARSH